MKRLQGKVAVVTGASRGAGRGIALALGSEGMTVYITGRSTRTGRRTLDRPETIEETAEMVTARGGRGIPVQVDHTQDEQVEALFAQVEREQGRLDILVNAVYGGNEVSTQNGRFWTHPKALWDSIHTAGVRAAYMASHFGAPLLIASAEREGRANGLIVNVSFLFNKYDGFLHYDVAKAALNRMAFAMAEDLRPHGVAAVALSPGWMRTEWVLDTFKATEASWREVPALARTESPEYGGRGVCALAADPNRMAFSGQTLRAGDLAKHYGFTDIDGRYVPPYVVE